MKNIEKSDENKLKISAPIWNEEFQLSDGSYSVSGNQDYFEYIIQRHETLPDNPPVRTHINKTENTITFKIRLT